MTIRYPHFMWLRQILARRYWGAKPQWHLSLRRRGLGDEPILIYQMGRVGSTTIHDELQRQAVDARIFHVHYLTKELLKKEEEIHRRSWKKKKRVGSEHVWQGQYLRRHLSRVDPARKWRVVTLVRDPVARNISDFFLMADREFDIDFASLSSSLTPDLVLDELANTFLERFERHDFPLTWFEVEFRPALGIDVYATPFSFEQGYQMYENGSFKVLLLRLEDFRDRAESPLREFLGLDALSLRVMNTAAEKPYAAVYKQFIENVKLPSAYLSRMYDSRYARHFYTPAEIDIFWTRWDKNRR